MGEAITIRAATGEDADGIARIYQESAAYHARLDPERYFIPASEATADRYRAGHQHGSEAADAITFVAEGQGEVVGFVDARLDRSPDPMHRDLVYCHIIEIAVSTGHQSRGIGARLLQAAEDWGRDAGAEFASLEYLMANASAADFYRRRMGYRPAGVLAIKRL
jgi:ribosomal protein S18 acetylase RimI-like enzyme